MDGDHINHTKCWVSKRGARYEQLAVYSLVHMKDRGVVLWTAQDCKKKSRMNHSCKTFTFMGSCRSFTKIAHPLNMNNPQHLWVDSASQHNVFRVHCLPLDAPSLDHILQGKQQSNPFMSTLCFKLLIMQMHTIVHLHPNSLTISFHNHCSAHC